MYHAIVRGKLRRVFEQLNRREFAAMPGLFATPAEHAFPGDHALGGTRRTAASIRRWYEQRLPQALPDLRFEVDHIVISGWPWHTVAAVEWRDSGTALDGQPFANQGVHVVTLRWGKVASLHIYCDTQMLAEVLQRNARHGAAEAAAWPIND
jgi:ketosteroid isomerase-like protein